MHSGPESIEINPGLRSVRRDFQVSEANLTSPFFQVLVSSGGDPNTVDLFESLLRGPLRREHSLVSRCSGLGEDARVFATPDMQPTNGRRPSWRARRLSMARLFIAQSMKRTGPLPGATDSEFITIRCQYGSWIVLWSRWRMAPLA